MILKEYRKKLSSEYNMASVSTTDYFCKNLIELDFCPDA